MIKTERLKLTNERELDALALVNHQHSEAIKRFPWWPVNPHVGLSIIQEEAGEATKATLDYEFKDGTIDEIIVEHAQAAAMHIRQIQYWLLVK